MKSKRFSLGLVVVLAGLGGVAEASSGYYRYPALHGDTVVFTAEGDLWSVPVSGGTARRLTTHPAEESQAAISPDGRTLAFVAGYDGGSDVYAMPLGGGLPKRLSSDGGRVWLQGFSPDGEVIYTTENVSGPSLHRVLRLVDPVRGGGRELPLADANEAGIDPATGTLWFTRFGLAVTGDNARGYRGGAISQLWRWPLDSRDEAQRVAGDREANLSRPMPWQGRLYLISDAEGDAANLWSMAPDGSDARPLTAHRDFEVRNARLHDGRIVYQHGADLRVFDIASGSDRAIPIELVSDFAQRRERFLRKPLDYLESARFALAGDRVALTARGRVALAGTGPLRRIELAAAPQARLREAVLSKDGKWVHAITDIDGRSEIWRYPSDGGSGAKSLVADEGSHRWRLYPSPDGRWLAHDDKRGNLWLLDLASGANRRIDRAIDPGDDSWASVTWSPDSRTLALVRAATESARNQVLLMDVGSGRQQVLTSDRYISFAPAFSRDGRWLYFLSDRSFQTSGAPWGDRNTGAVFDRRTKIYALALQRGARFPFLPPDELRSGNERTEDTSAQSKPDEDKPVATPKTLPAIEWDGLAERLFEVPLPAGNYRALAADAQRLYLLERDSVPAARGQLRTLAIAEATQPELYLPDVLDFTLSADARKLLIVRARSAGPTQPPEPGEMLILPAADKAPTDRSKSLVRVADWALAVSPADEWRQMFDDAWRMHRDFSFDASMRAQDWRAVRGRYGALLPRVNDRAELSDLLAQMSSELGILHSQVRAGELRADPESPTPSSLGAVLTAGDRGVRIAHIYRTEPELPTERGPLQQPGVDARAGDVIVAINGTAVRTPADVAMRLRQQAGQQVLLELRRGGATHRTVVQPVPLGRDAELRYGDWVQATRAKVEAASGGRIGYLHLRAMTAADMAGFVREFYANVDREGLIIDVRRNRGGNIDSWIIEKLLRRAWAYWKSSEGTPYWNMQQTFRGHLAVLTDALTYSDGETFAAGVKALGLGPVIGTRTAGAGVWLSDRNALSDGGMARVAEFAQFDREGRWLIEGRGVSPDVVVENLPVATARGQDAQLQTAIEHLQKQLQTSPLPEPKPESIPGRGRYGHDGSR